MDIKWEFDDFKEFEKSLSDGAFGNEMKGATEDVAKSALGSIKRMTPKVTNKLKSGWDGNDCKAESTNQGFASELINKVEYAYHVNDGHRVRNREDGAYYKVKHRIKVPIASEHQDNTSEWYVFGHFFVEQGLKSTKEKTKRIVNRRMDKWWKDRFK